MKNSNSNTSRLLLLCRKSMVENWKKILLTMAGVIGVLSIVLIMRAYTTASVRHYISATGIDLQGFTYPTFFLFLFAFGMICASFTFMDLSSKQGRFSFLIVPVSSGEKFLSRWLMSTFLFLIIYPIGYLIALGICSLFLTVFYSDIQHVLISIDGMSQYLSNGNGQFKFMFVSFYFLIQSSYILGSIVWPKMSFVKTTAFIVGVFTFIMYVSRLIIIRIEPVNLLRHEIAFNTLEGVSRIQLCIGIFFSCMAILMWMFSYYRFKKIDLIKRPLFK